MYSIILGKGPHYTARPYIFMEKKWCLGDANMF
jgi:hypothetical protein